MLLPVTCPPLTHCFGASFNAYTLTIAKTILYCQGDNEKYFWTSLTAEQNVNAAKKNFTFYTGSCSADEQEALTRIRLNFLDAVKNSPLANYALCSVSQGQDCVVENVKVYCGTNSRRKRGLDNSERIITFDFVIHDKNASTDPVVEAAKYVASIIFIVHVNF